MRIPGQILSVPIFDCVDIKNINIKHEPSRIIVRGENVCKIFEFVKGVTYEVSNTTNTINAILDTKLLHESKLKKHIDLIIDISKYNNFQNNKLFWNRLLESSESVNTMTKLFKYEKKINYCTHSLLENSNVVLTNDMFCEIHESQLKISQKSSDKIMTYKKSLGGIIFDEKFNFLEDFINTDLKRSKESKNKNIIIADSLPKSYNFLHINTLNERADLTNKRILIYYPTEHTINKIIDCISNGINKPSTLWIVFPKQTKKSNEDLCDYKKILNILFWSKTEFSCNNGLNLVSINYKNLEEIVDNKTISIQRVKFNLNEIETNLIKSCEDIATLDNFYFSNIGNHSVCAVYDADMCPICTKDIINKTIFSCGHTFCEQCSFEICKYNFETINCPMCKTHIKSYPNIVNLELTKLIVLKKLLIKLIETKNEMDNILIYVDTKLISKGLLQWLRTNFKDVPSNIVNQRKVYLKKTILICPKDIFYVAKNIKGVKEVISIATNHDFVVNTEALGYDYYFANSDVRLWMFEPKI